MNEIRTRLTVGDPCPHGHTHTDGRGRYIASMDNKCLYCYNERMQYQRDYQKRHREGRKAA